MNMLAQRLSELKRLHQRTVRRERVFRAGAWLLAALLLAIWLDALTSIIGYALAGDPFAVVTLPMGLRVLIGLVVIALAVNLAWSSRLPGRVRRMRMTDYARWCELAMGISDNRLVNALQLTERRAHAAEQHASVRWLNDDLAAKLIERSGALAEQSSEVIQPNQIVDQRAVSRSLRWFSIVIAAWLVTIGVDGLTPGPMNVMRSGGRVLAFWADRLPATLSRLHVSIQPDPIGIGDDVRVSVTVQGQPVRAARLRVLDRADAGAASANAMALASRSEKAVGDGELGITLREVSDPLRFVIEGGGSYCKPIVVTPHPRPRITSVQLIAELPELDQSVPVAFEAGRPVRLPVGSRLNVRVTTNMADTLIKRIDEAAADGEVDADGGVSIIVERAAQAIELVAVSPLGLASRPGVQLRVVGVTDEAEREAMRDTAQMLADAQGEATDAMGSTSDPSREAADQADAMSNADAASMRAADLNGGEQVEPGDQANDQASDDPRQTTTQRTGVATQLDQPGRTGGLPTDATEAIQPELAAAVARIWPGATHDRRRRAWQYAADAPPGYRELVAAYYLRIQRDQTEAEP